MNLDGRRADQVAMIAGGLLIVLLGSTVTTAQDRPFLTDRALQNVFRVQVFTDPTERYTAFVGVLGGQTNVVVLDWQTEEFVGSADVGTTDSIILMTDFMELGGKHLLPMPRLKPVSRGIQTTTNVADQWVFEDTSEGVKRMRTPDIEAPFPDLVAGLHESSANGLLKDYSSSALAWKLRDGWVLEGVYYPTNALNNPALLVRPWGFLRTDPITHWPMFSAREHESLVRRSVGQLVQADEPLDSPLSDSVRFNWEQDLLKMEVVDPVDGNVRQTVDVATIPNRDNDAAVAFLTKGQLAVITNARVYRFEASEVPPPEVNPAWKLRFRLRQSHLVASADGVAEFRHELEGATAPVKFSVVGPKVGDDEFPVAIDGNGTVRVDTGKAIDWLVPHLKERWKDQPSSILNDYLRTASGEFRKIVGRQPQGIPVLLGLSVSATDAADQTTPLAYEFFVEIPREKWGSKSSGSTGPGDDTDDGGGEDARTGGDDGEEAGPSGLAFGLAAGIGFVGAVIGVILALRVPRGGFGIAAAASLGFTGAFLPAELNTPGLSIAVALMSIPLIAAVFGFTNVRDNAVTKDGKGAAIVALVAALLGSVYVAMFFPHWLPFAIVWFALQIPMVFAAAAAPTAESPPKQ